MLSHCRPPPTVGHGEFFAGHTQAGRLNRDARDRDSDQPSITGGKKNGWQKFQSALCRGARGARARFKDGVREHPRRRTHPGASTDNAGTRTRGRVGVRARGFAGARPPASAPGQLEHSAQRAPRAASSNGAARVPMVRSRVPRAREPGLA
jgi:hypothetical protein